MFHYGKPHTKVRIAATHQCLLVDNSPFELTNKYLPNITI